MNKIFLFSLSIILLIPLPLRAQDATPSTLPPQNITLKDGSVIKGRLIGISNDRYAIETMNLGQIEVKITEVENISSGIPAAPAPANPSGTTNAMALPTMPVGGEGSPLPTEGSMPNLPFMTDPQVIEAAQELEKDPEIMQLIQDPAIMQAAMSMDPSLIENNPSVKKLLENPKWQKFMTLMTEKMLGQMGTGSGLNLQNQ